MTDSAFRIRFSYSKRYRSCFVPHVVIPQVFYRAMRRGGMQPLMSQGFSPRPRITLGPALPVGIVGLSEPAEVWFENNVDSFTSLINNYLPTGFHVNSSTRLDDGPSLNKQCEAASYMIRSRDMDKTDVLFSELIMAPNLKENILDCYRASDHIRVILANPGGLGPGVIIRYFQQKNIIRKWSEICLVRTVVGRWNGSSVLPLIREDQ